MALPSLDWSRQRQRCPPFRQRLHRRFTPGWARQEALGLNQWLAAGYSATIFATPSRIFSALPSDPPTTAVPTPRKTSFLVRAFVILGHVGIGHRRAGPHSVISVTVGPATVIAISPVSILLHRDFLLNENVPHDIEIGFLARCFGKSLLGDFFSHRIAERSFCEG